MKQPNHGSYIVEKSRPFFSKLASQVSFAGGSVVSHDTSEYRSSRQSYQKTGMSFGQLCMMRSPSSDQTNLGDTLNLRSQPCLQSSRISSVEGLIKVLSEGGNIFRLSDGN